MIFPKRHALPRPRAVESVNLPPHTTARESLDGLISEYEQVELRAEELQAQIERFAYESICGAVDETQHVELYDGTLGAPRAFVDQYEPPVAQLQWLDDFAERFSGSNDHPGDLSGIRWGSGALVGPDIFMTAGHLFDTMGGGWLRPKHDGETLSPPELAQLMRANFNYQVNGLTGEVRPEDTYPVVDLLEYRLGGVDFALLRLGRNEDGRFPGETYRWLAVAATDTVSEGDILCMIQHPAGKPKMVEAGELTTIEGTFITYDSLDTLGGSSGAPILSDRGEVVGVHTNGGCSFFNGANRGVAVGSIRSVSGMMRSLPDSGAIPLQGDAQPEPEPSPEPEPEEPERHPVPGPHPDAGSVARGRHGVSHDRLARLETIIEALTQTWEESRRRERPPE